MAGGGERRRAILQEGLNSLIVIIVVHSRRTTLRATSVCFRVFLYFPFLRRFPFSLYLSPRFLVSLSRRSTPMKAPSVVFRIQEEKTREERLGEIEFFPTLDYARSWREGEI